ncbi:MAG TPA: 1-(5-phosphoribosyl)-5-[(5-phosphoribosylamino)methylideneamino] imidazole-4-carboxamide isomerase [Caldilineae bacterium]|nr:1-(5-phosphoribosyl)-5-[(5-phosphoribosylamino)methylideneamino] imidazole-4-carboxamide isomerase [Caldilineae bacterium]
MIIFPAIDLRQGRCVRLRQGDPKAETVFSDDPVAMARHWAGLGAQWLHVVNLDGAFGEKAKLSGPTIDFSPDRLALLPTNLQRLHAIRQAVDVPIQFGGGMRSLEDVALALTLGANRVVLGTVAVREPTIVPEALARFGPARIVVGIDAREGRVATHGWAQTSGLDAVELAGAMKEVGVERIVYTDISRDGMLSGVNIEATVDLARRSGLAVIASGGVRGLDDIRRLLDYEGDGVEGVITGQAIYTGALDLGEAIRLSRREPPNDEPSINNQVTKTSGRWR